MVKNVKQEEPDSTYALLQKKKKRENPRRTTEEKELLHKRALRYMFPLEEEKWSEEEIRQQEQDLILHKPKKVIQQEVPKVKDRKKLISDLLCFHKKTIRKGEFIICTKCGYKWKAKVKNKTGTSK